MSITRISIGQISGEINKWGLSLVNDFGLSDCFSVGTNAQSQTEAYKLMQKNPKNWIEIQELDGNISYFDKDKCYISLSKLNETNILCITTDGCHPYRMKISNENFNKYLKLYLKKRP